jgi:N-acetylglucosaminyldiphosphoundecaprenol N-acetyl-beta-D-mannosaminyltransferase
VNPTPFTSDSASTWSYVAPIVPQNAVTEIREAPISPAAEKIDVETVSVWGVPFASVTMQGCLDFIDRWIVAYRRRAVPSGYTVTANLHYVMLHHEHPRMAEVTREASLIIADGMPIVWRSRLGAKRLPERVAGADLIYDIAKLAAQKGYRLFLFGAAEGVAQQAGERLSQMYPGLQLAGCYTPPFRPLSEAEEAAMIQQIRDTKPDIMLVALGQPKGELWVLDHYRDVGAAMMIQVGASFDFIIGKVHRAPKFFQKTGLEWLYRALSEPKRLVPRYAQNFRFLARMMWQEMFGRGSANM